MSLGARAIIRYADSLDRQDGKIEQSKHQSLDSPLLK
jgi:hypothetical protein